MKLLFFLGKKKRKRSSFRIQHTAHVLILCRVDRDRFMIIQSITPLQLNINTNQPLHETIAVPYNKQKFNVMCIPGDSKLIVLLLLGTIS
jgi:hypothetical protein